MRLKDESAQKFRRQMVVRLHEEGHFQAKIAELLEISQSYVSQVLSRYKQQGSSALEVSRAKGAIARLDDQQKAQLSSIIDAGAPAYGFEGALWTSRRIKWVIEEKFGVLYSQRQVDRILKQLNYTPQKPQKVDYRQSKEAVDRWKTDQLPTLKKKERQKAEK